MRYTIWEGFMADLEKKVATIRRKCERYGCEFHFEKVGEEIQDVKDYTRIDPETGEPLTVKCKFIVCDVEGTAKVNGWQFVASVDHTAKGNIFSKALTDIAIPERYRTSKCYCEHCNSNRQRKNTFIIQNTETGEFKQVGNNCLNDYTNGMSASSAAYMASLKNIFEEAEEREVGGNWGFYQRYYDTEEFLRYTAETIRHYGYSKSDDSNSTKDRTLDFFNVAHGNTRWMTSEEIQKIKDMMEQVGFNADSEEAAKMTENALTWLSNQEAKNDYMHNLKVVASLEHTDGRHFGLLVSLFPTWNRELEAEAQRKAEAEAGKASEFVGRIGDRVELEVEAVKCITSWESCYNGYSTTTTYVWKIIGKDGNVYTWKTSKWLNEEKPPVSIKGTVKEHKIFREVKQTELTRCKVTKEQQKPQEKPEPWKYEGSAQEGFDTFWSAVNE